MELGVHLPLIDFEGEGLSRRRLDATVDAARELGLAAVSANDHHVFSTPWLDGPTALAAAVARSGGMELATTIANVVVRGPVATARALAAIDVLSDGRAVAGVGPGSSPRDYEAVGIPFDQRWPRFEEASAALRALIRGGDRPSALRYYAMPSSPLEPPPVDPGGIPLWLASWGSVAGLRRVARLGDGWLASAYNTTPEELAAGRERLRTELESRGREGERLPNALATMWTWVTDDCADAARALERVVGPMLRRDPDTLRGRLCIGSPSECAELLARYAASGCERVYVWPLRDEPAQLERLVGEVMPAVG